jgi:hypothetical protein
VCWVAGESCLSGGCDQSQRSSSGDARGTVGVRVSWVAGESSAGGSGSHQRQGTVGGNTLDAARVLVSRVASEVAGSD